MLVYLDNFDKLSPKENTPKAMGEHGIKPQGKNLKYLDYVDDLNVPFEIVSEMNKCLEVLRV